jgi:hypothetical protein
VDMLLGGYLHIVWQLGFLSLGLSALIVAKLVVSSASTGAHDAGNILYGRAVDWICLGSSVNNIAFPQNAISNCPWVCGNRHNCHDSDWGVSWIIYTLSEKEILQDSFHNSIHWIAPGSNPDGLGYRANHPLGIILVD